MSMRNEIIKACKRVASGNWSVEARVAGYLLLIGLYSISCWSGVWGQKSRGVRHVVLWCSVHRSSEIEMGPWLCFTFCMSLGFLLPFFSSCQSVLRSSGRPAICTLLVTVPSHAGHVCGAYTSWLGCIVYVTALCHHVTMLSRDVLRPSVSSIID